MRWKWRHHFKQTYFRHRPASDNFEPRDLDLWSLTKSNLSTKFGDPKFNNIFHLPRVVIHTFIYSTRTYPYAALLYRRSNLDLSFWVVTGCRERRLKQALTLLHFILGFSVRFCVLHGLIAFYSVFLRFFSLLFSFDRRCKCEIDRVRNDLFVLTGDVNTVKYKHH